MDYKQYGSGWWWLILLSTSFINLLQQNQFQAYKISNNKHHPHHYGPPTNVTKTLHFPNFNPIISTLTHHDQVKLLGNAGISKDKGVIQIPDASQAVDCTYQVGRALYSSPIRLFDPLTLTPASFQTTFSFQLNATTTYNNSSSGGGGLAFVMVPDEFTIGRPGPWLGILNDACNRYKVFAVEFDTSHDPELGDPNDDHVGINVGAIVSFKTANSSEARISLHSNSLHRAWITYDAYRRWIDVHLGSDGDPIPTQPILSLPLNLSPFLEEYMFVGFSASTGNSTQIHNIISWNFSSIAQAFLQLPSTKVCHRNIHHQVSKYSTMSHYNPPSSFLVFVAVLGLCSVALLSFYFNSQSKESSISLLLTEKKQRPMPPGKPRRFTVPELHKATRGFSNVQVLTSDSGGVLYRGILSNGCRVAVKRYFSTQSLTNSTTRLYWSRDLKRIGDLTRISHPSLAPIRGWCCDGPETIVVYDYYQFGSMDTWLCGVGALPWTRRSQLIKDVAEALSYLHSKELAHGNVKTSSVFFDANYRAVLGDYGFILSEGGGGESKLGKKDDVFWFGMFVMEIVAAKKGINGWRDEEGGEKGVLGFVRKMHERRELVKVVDDKIGHCINFEEEAVQVLKMGLNCTASDVNARPCMEEVVHFFNMQCLNHRVLPRQPI